MIEKHAHTLELPAVLSMLAETAVCEDTKAMAMAIVPAADYPMAVRRMQYTSGANALSNRFGYPGIYHMVNCVALCKRAELGSRLSLKELISIKTILQTQRNLQEYHRQAAEIPTALDGLFEALYSNRPLENRLNDSIASEEELDDNASAALSDLRRKIRQAGLKVRSQLDSMIRSSSFQKYLQDPIVTMREGRFVLPIKQEYKNEVKGLVHDTSASGATYFIEPMSVVTLNNEIRVLEQKEQQEIDRIILELSRQVGEISEPLQSGYHAAIELDLYFAKSRLGDRMRGTVPILTDDGAVVLRKARHPMIPYEKAVPIDIAVGKDYDTLVITGPNTGGKTVAIKTLGLLTLMAMCGLMLPASSSSSVSIFGQVLADIGDEQSIAQSLSTFSAHMVNIISIVEEADYRSLVLLDELGAGTDPVEGAALAVSILETLRKKGAKLAATTHYPEIKMYALETEGVENASCEFDVQTLSPTYRLLTGIPGRSNAFLISERLGLPMAVIEGAKNLVSAESTRFEDVVSDLEATRQELEREKDAARRLRAEAETLQRQMQSAQETLEAKAEAELQKAREQAKRIIEDTRLQAEILLEDLDRVKKEKDKAHFSDLLFHTKQEYRSTLKEMRETSDGKPQATPEAPYVLPRPLEKGDIVFIRTLNQEGIVLKKPEGKSVYIQAGFLKTSVPLSEVVLGAAPKPAKRSGAKLQTQGKHGGKIGAKGADRAVRDVQMELDLRGQDAEQAILELNQFIDRAVMSGLSTVRIIHGKGTGVLRAAVAQRLKAHRNVASFRLGQYGEGENGVTIAELR